MSDFLDLHDDASARRVLYLGAILLIGVPFVQAASQPQMWPMQFGNIQWRFLAANAFSAVLLLPFLGFTLLLMMARALESRTLSKVVGVCSGLFTALLAASFVVFILDALQLKTIVSTQMEAAFKTTAVRVLFTTVMFTVGFLILALAGFKTPRATAVRSGGASSSRRAAPPPARGDADEADDASPGLIVGR